MDGWIAIQKLRKRTRTIRYDWDKIGKAAFKDKKADGDKVSVTIVKEIGSFEMKTLKCVEVIEMAKSCLQK